MRMGFAVNEVQTEKAKYTTTRIAMAAHNRGHKVWMIGSGDYEYDVDEKISAVGHRGRKKKYRSLKAFLQDIQNEEGKVERITVDDLDVLMLRSDPSIERGTRAWAQTAHIVFGQLAMKHGVIVLNDPDGLSRATSKIYLQSFPREVRPKTLITRDRSEIRSFAKQTGGSIVLKPLRGSGGRGVFLLRQDDMANLNQMVEAVARDGYVIAQEFLPAAAQGDTRLFLMNGLPLRYKGKYAAFRRVRTGEDIRSNIQAGGQKAAASITDVHLRLAEMVRPKLVEDGMFLVGLDIAGEKLMEINVFSPGGLGSAQLFEKQNFVHPILDAMERKVQYMSYYRRKFSNLELATL